MATRKDDIRLKLGIKTNEYWLKWKFLIETKWERETERKEDAK